MISVSDTAKRGMGRRFLNRNTAEDTAGPPGNPAVGTVCARPSSADGPNHQQGATQVPPTDHSNFVDMFCGNENAEASWHDSTTRQGLSTRHDNDTIVMSMPHLSRYDEVVMRCELDQKKAENDLCLEVE